MLATHPSQSKIDNIAANRQPTNCGYNKNNKEISRKKKD